MKAVRWTRDNVPNYGDMLNDFLWPNLLCKEFVSVNPDALFYGIGTLIGEPASMLKGKHHVVFGAGLGYSGNPDPALWKTYFVRGPVTAKFMNAPYITDPGVLMRRFFSKGAEKYPVSFMPRFDSISTELRHGCLQADIHLINPLDSVEKVTYEIASTGLLLTEALHGAVVADAIRVPWICIRARYAHDTKWYDWCGSMNMIWNPIDASGLGLTWARRYAIPQLSALSVLDSVTSRIEEQIGIFNEHVRKGSVCE